MSLFINTDENTVLITCKCGCQSALQIQIDPDDENAYSFLSHMNGNFYRDQYGTFGVIKEKVKRMERCLDDVLKEKVCFNLRQLEISGKDLIRLGIPEGKEIGDMLNKLLEKVISGEVENSREKLMEVVNENFSS